MTKRVHTALLAEFAEFMAFQMGLLYPKERWLDLLKGVQAASKEFSSVIDGYGYSRLAVIARYYLALSQLKLSQNQEAVKNLESVSNNSRNRPIAFLAKRSLANYRMEIRDYKGAQQILESLIQDPQCDLPKEDMKTDLAIALDAQGKRDAAIRLLKEARDQAGTNALTARLVEELKRLQENPNPLTQGVQPTQSPR